MRRFHMIAATPARSKPGARTKRAQPTAPRSRPTARRDPEDAKSRMSSPEELAEFGRRIRNLRVERQMTLRQVEEASGLSATHLSEIERGRTSPTLGALIRIARSLGKEPAFFIERDELTDVAHVQREQRTVLSPSRGVAAEALTRGIPGSGIFAYRVTLEPPGELRFEPRCAGGDTIYYLLRGAVRADIGEQRLQLTAGDALHASLSLEQRVVPVEEPAELIVVSTYPLEAGRITSAEARR